MKTQHTLKTNGQFKAQFKGSDKPQPNIFKAIKLYILNIEEYNGGAAYLDSVLKALGLNNRTTLKSSEVAVQIVEAMNIGGTKVVKRKGIEVNQVIKPSAYLVGRWLDTQIKVYNANL